jgi:hypothetical protein
MGLLKMNQYLLPLISLGFLISGGAAGQQVPDKVMNQSLMIIDPQIIGSKTTPPKRASWTFGSLMKQMSGGTGAGQFVVKWLRQFDSDQTINGFKVAARKSVRSVLADPWQAKDGFAGKSDAEWAAGLKLENAPFRLSAIVYRPDLLTGNVNGDGPHWAQSGGEGRFIFQAVNDTGDPLRMTVIFEFDLPAKLPSEVIDWAKQWSSLAGLDISTDAYATALETITKKFSNADPNLERPNNVPLNQLRTNEFLGGGADGPWELREFKIFGGQLTEDTVKRNPDISFDKSQALAAYVTSIATDSSLLVVPARLNDKPFLAGSSLAPNPAFKWTLPGITDEKLRKFKFAINTCNGCHTGETNTFFLQVDLGALTKRQSDFLVGTKDVTCDAVNEDAKTEAHDEGIGDLKKRECLMDALTALSDTDAAQILTNLHIKAPAASVLTLRPKGFDVRQFLLSRRNRSE